MLKNEVEHHTFFYKKVNNQAKRNFAKWAIIAIQREWFIILKMYKNIFEKVIGAGLFLIIISFNPYIFPGLYIDSFSSYGFISSIKIVLLGILNIVLSIIWIWKIWREKEISLIQSKIFIPIAILLFSSIISLIFSGSRIVSLWGYNATLESSFVEFILLLIFFVIFINNIRTKEAIQGILRVINIGFSLITLYMVIRFIGNWTINTPNFSNYLNQATFYPGGNYSSAVLVALFGFISSLILIISDFILKNAKWQLYTDYFTTFTLGIGFGVLVNLGSYVPEYLFLSIGILSLSALFYFVFKNKRLKENLKHLIIVSILPILLGVGINFFITINGFQPTFYPSVALSETWEITQKSVNSPEKIILGNGQGSFANLFDKNKPESISQAYKVGESVLSNFSVNSNSPITEEIRSFQGSSYLLNIFSSQGILGIAGIVLLLVYAVIIAMQKKNINTNLYALFGLISLCVIIISSLFLKYDFIISLLIWLCLGIFIISVEDDEEDNAFSIDKIVNGNLSILNYILPTVLVLVSASIVFVGIQILGANYYANIAKQNPVNSSEFKDNIEIANETFQYSDIFIREKAAAKSIDLFEQYKIALEIVEKDPSNTQKILEESNKAESIRTELVANIDKAIDINKAEYKNYYFTGIILSASSEFTKTLSQDQIALDYLLKSIENNPDHPDTNYQIAKIYYRNSQNTAALNTIQNSVRLRGTNLQYAEIYADILRASGNYQNALQIYNQIKSIRDNNPDNQYIQNFYIIQNIDQDINDANSKISPTPTPG